MTGTDDTDRILLVDASVFITLSKIGLTDLLWNLRGSIVVPTAVENEIVTDPAASRFAAAKDDDRIQTGDAIGYIENEYLEIEETRPSGLDLIRRAGSHLGKDLGNIDLTGFVSEKIEGDTALLAIALALDDAVVVTDDKPLRKTCKALGIPVSGSIGVVIRAVEQDELDPDDAKEALVSMDEVGAHLSASLLRKAERMIDDAATDRND